MDETKFLHNVIKSDTCWLWQGRPGSHGYGVVPRGHTQKLLAHRVAYSLFVGEIPAGQHVLHRCDVRLCVRPDHLFLGTQADNNADMMRKGRFVSGHAKKTECPRGHPYSMRTSKGGRGCRLCANAAQAEYLKRKKETK